MTTRYAKRHYIDVAEILHRERVKRGYDDIIDSLAAQFAATFEVDNENFNRDRFLMAVRDGIGKTGAAIRGGPAMPYYENAVDYSGDRPRAPHKGRRYSQ